MKQKTAPRYKLDPKHMKQLVNQMGSCCAVNNITVDGRKVGFMERYKSTSTADSGWRFYAGGEDRSYEKNGDNWGTFTLNEMANYDPDIIPLLTSSSGSKFRRAGEDFSGDFEPYDD